MRNLNIQETSSISGGNLITVIDWVGRAMVVKDVYDSLEKHHKDQGITDADDHTHASGFGGTYSEVFDKPEKSDRDNSSRVICTLVRNFFCLFIDRLNNFFTRTAPSGVLFDPFAQLKAETERYSLQKQDKIDRLPLPEALCDQPLTLKLHHSGKVKCYGKVHREEMKKI